MKQIASVLLSSPLWQFFLLSPLMWFCILHAHFALFVQRCSLTRVAHFKWSNTLLTMWQHVLLMQGKLNISWNDSLINCTRVHLHDSSWLCLLNNCLKSSMLLLKDSCFAGQFCWCSPRFQISCRSWCFHWLEFCWIISFFTHY